MCYRPVTCDSPSASSFVIGLHRVSQVPGFSFYLGLPLLLSLFSAPCECCSTAFLCDSKLRVPPTFFTLIFFLLDFQGAGGSELRFFACGLGFDAVLTARLLSDASYSLRYFRIRVFCIFHCSAS